MTEKPTRRDFRHTKIVCTLGPASSSEETLRAMATAGMNIARLNMSHGSHESHGEFIRTIKKLNKELNHPVALLLDTQGPEIRTGEREHPLHLEVGQIITPTVRPEDAEEESVHGNFQDLVNDLRVGDRVTGDSGIITLEVLEIEPSKPRCKVL